MGKNKIFINFIFQEQFLLFLMNTFSKIIIIIMNKIETITTISENNENKAKVISNILGKIEILIVSYPHKMRE